MEEVKNINKGRPLKFKTPEELEKKIQEYFDKCDNHTREVVIKNGKNTSIQKVKDPIPYTISGLAVHLDTSRETLMNYQAREEFFDTIKKAKDKCLADAERRLFQDFTPGVIFSMKNNYGFVDKQEIGTTPGQPFEVNNKLNGASEVELSEILEFVRKQEKGNVT